MARCRGPANRLIMFRKKGLSGPFFQNAGGGMCIKTMGNAFDVGGALAGLKPLNGYTGPATGCGDADGTTVTVNFSKAVTWINHAGVNISATGGKTFNITGPVGGTASQIEYVGTWTVEPIAGDVITYQYTAASGNYVDSEGEPMADAGPLTLTNCLDPTGGIPNGSIIDPTTRNNLIDPTGGAYIVDPNPV